MDPLPASNTVVNAIESRRRWLAKRGVEDTGFTPVVLMVEGDAVEARLDTYSCYHPQVSYVSAVRCVSSASFFGLVQPRGSAESGSSTGPLFFLVSSSSLCLRREVCVFGPPLAAGLWPP